MENPSPKKNGSPRALLGQKIETPERGYLAREVFYFSLCQLLFSLSERRGYIIRSQKPERTEEGILFGRKLEERGAWFGIARHDWTM